MRIYSYNKEYGREITAYQSNFILSPILRQEINQIHIACMHLDSNGIIGYHKATKNQLLLIIDGEGFVRGEDDQYVKVRKGDAVFWERGEGHETKTEKGMTAFVVEADDLDPSKMKLKRGES